MAEVPAEIVAKAQPEAQATPASEAEVNESMTNALQWVVDAITLLGGVQETTGIEFPYLSALIAIKEEMEADMQAIAGETEAPAEVPAEALAAV